MKKMTALAALSLTALLPFTQVPAFAETRDAQATLCAEAPQQAAKAGIDCTATSATGLEDDATTKKYPTGPVSFGNGIVF